MNGCYCRTRCLHDWTCAHYASAIVLDHKGLGVVYSWLARTRLLSPNPSEVFRKSLGQGVSFLELRGDDTRSGDGGGGGGGGGVEWCCVDIQRIKFQGGCGGGGGVP